MSKESQKHAITISEEEAVVLFEFLSRFSEEKKLSIEDQAEERELWNLCCELESQLVQPFAPDYARILAEARAKVRDPIEPIQPPETTRGNGP